MGFVAFPGSADGQPPRSGPGVALQIQRYYKEYLQAFDHSYIVSFVDIRNKSPNNGGNIVNPRHVAFQITGWGGEGLMDPARMQVPNPNGGNGMRMDPRQSTQLLQYANRTVAELRQMNVDEAIITFIEGNRATLQRAYQDQLNFRGQVQGGAGLQQQGLPPNGDGSLGGMGNPGGPQPPPFSAALGGLPGQMQDPRMLARGGMPATGPNNFMAMQAQGGMMGGPLGTPLPHHQQPGQGQRMQPGGQMAPGMHLLRQVQPSKEQTQHALTFITRVKQEFTANSTFSSFSSALKPDSWSIILKPFPTCLRLTYLRIKERCTIRCWRICTRSRPKWSPSFRLFLRC